MEMKKKISRRQLEKQSEGQKRHIENGRDLLHRMTRRIAEQDRYIQGIEARVRVAGVYIGVLSGITGQKTISKADITEFLNTKSVQLYESEDKSEIIINVMEAVHETIEEAVETSDTEDNQGIDRTDTDNDRAIDV